MRAGKLKIVSVLVSYLLVIGCTSTHETPTLTSAAEPTRPVNTATVTPSPAAAKTPTPTPQPTVLPVKTPYPTPEAPLYADGPWLVFPAALNNPEKNQGFPPYLWAMNADGTGLTMLDPDPVEIYILRPNNTGNSHPTLVYITSKAEARADYTLKMITLPDLEITTITPLFGTDEISGAHLLPYRFRWYLWSSDGNTLVFIGSLDGNRLGIYTYSFITNTITRLTSDNSIDYDESDEEQAFGDQGHACCLEWSPDERYVIYQPFPTEVSVGGQPIPLGLAATRFEGGRSIRMIDMSADFEVFGWYSPNEILLQDKGLTDDEPASGIYAFNLDTGESTIIIDEAVEAAAYAEKHDTWLYTSGGEAPLILYKDGIATEVYNPGISYLSWWEKNNAFITGGYIITLDGRISQIVPRPTPHPSFWMGEFNPEQMESPDGAFWAWVDLCYTLEYRFRDLSCGLWVGAPNSVPSEIFTSPEENYDEGPDHILLRSITWSPDSQQLIYLTDHGLFIAERPDFEPILIAQIYGYDWIRQPMMWVEK